MSASQESVYGMSHADIHEQYLNSLTYKVAGLDMVVTSILSDCQEIGVSNAVRQQLNIAKYLLGLRMTEHFARKGGDQK
jgi:hypothetical protein